jgi:uncharacterized protein (DUF779 family)
MDERQAQCSITATDAAIQALDTLSREHGPLILHITAGGDDSGTPMCLPAAELRIGARDIYLGTVHGVDVFEMRSHMDSHFRAGSFVLDVSRGLPVGFSLTPGDHLRFVVKDSDQFTTSASMAEASDEAEGTSAS